MNKFDFLQPMLEDAVSDGVFPSAVAAVGVRDQVMATVSVGDATPETRFDMASVTKVMATTMLALMALEEGALTLQDSLSQYFPAPADKADITIFELLTHTGGFTPSFWLFSEINSPSEAAAAILRHPLEARPDGTPRYSCMGFILLGKLLEGIYGKPLDVLAQERVFAPLGMSHTGYNPQGGNIAPTEVDLETGIAWCGVVHDENAQFMGGVSGNAGVFSDIADCCRFAAMLAAGDDGFLSPATLRKAITDYTPNAEEHRGLGFQVGGKANSFMGDLFPAASFGHAGFTGTSLLVDPTSGLYAILLSNRIHPTRENEGLTRFRKIFHNRIYAAASRT